MTWVRMVGPWIAALVATVAVLATIAPEVGGPGITCDEPYHVAYGKRLVWSLRQQGLKFFTPSRIRQNFDWQADGPPVHPPLGNWVLGWTHHLFDPAPDDLAVVSVVAARFAPALALGLMVLLVGWATTRMEGPLAGTVAAATVFLVPRVFGHAHLAALDTFTALGFVAATVAVVEADARGGRWGHFALAGVVCGLALLTRLHGFLLIPPVAVWVLWRRRWRGLGLLAAWLASAMAVFYAGWPWLWLAPIGHLRQFFSSATSRMPIHVFYAGRVWPDAVGAEVPRHYTLVMFLVALPLGLLVLGLVGLWVRRRLSQAHPAYVLVTGTLLFLLVVFSLPGTPLYDGARLFLMVFPFWAIPVGIGAKALVELPAWRAWPARARIATIAVLVGIQGIGLALYHPYQLSHYSLLVGGLWGAERLGFEVTYWGDTVAQSLLAEAVRRAPGQAVVYGPNLAPFQAPIVGMSSASLEASRTRLVGWDSGRPEIALGARYGVFYHRKADLGGLPRGFLQGWVVAEVNRQGVWLARLVEFPEPIGQGRLRSQGNTPPGPGQ